MRSAGRGVQTPGGRRGRTRLTVLVTGVVVVLALAGCSRPASQAALVGDVAISNAELEATTEAAAEALETDLAGINRNAVLVSLIQGAMVDQIVADDPELAITGTDRAAVLQSQPQLQQLSGVPGAAPLVDSLVEITVLQQQLGPEEFAARYTVFPVEVNPRWGEWDPESPSGITGDGSLSVDSSGAGQ